MIPDRVMPTLDTIGPNVVAGTNLAGNIKQYELCQNHVSFCSLVLTWVLWQNGVAGMAWVSVGCTGATWCAQQMPRNVYRLKQALPPSRLWHILAATLVMQFHTAAEQHRRKASIRLL